jgi:hypothetical protein
MLTRAMTAVDLMLGGLHANAVASPRHYPPLVYTSYVSATPSVSGVAWQVST